MRADPTYVSFIAQALGNATKVSNDLASQLSSGLRVGSLSDDPTAAAQSLQLGNRIAQIDSYIQTASGETSMRPAVTQASIMRWMASSKRVRTVCGGCAVRSCSTRGIASRLPRLRPRQTAGSASGTVSRLARCAAGARCCERRGRPRTVEGRTGP